VFLSVRPPEGCRYHEVTSTPGAGLATSQRGPAYLAGLPHPGEPPRLDPGYGPGGVTPPTRLGLWGGDAASRSSRRPTLPRNQCRRHAGPAHRRLGWGARRGGPAARCPGGGLWLTRRNRCFPLFDPTFSHRGGRGPDFGEHICTHGNIPRRRFRFLLGAPCLSFSQES